jgi:adenylate kinase
MTEMKAIIITGSVATGKTTLAKKLAKKHGFTTINLSNFIKSNHLSDGYDKKRKCVVVDTKKLSKHLIKQVLSSKKQLIIDGHLSHCLPKKYVGQCIVTTCNLKELHRRLKKRKYSCSKIQENLQAEIFQVSLLEAKKKYKKIKIIDTTKGIKL